MQNTRLTLPQIGGREVVPVRFLPVMTDWLPLSPDTIAAVLSLRHPLHRWQCSSHRLVGGGDVAPMLPREWDDVEDRLQALQAQLQREGLSEAEQYMEWKKASLRLLPAGAFLWRDEFEQDYARTFAREDYATSKPSAQPFDEAREEKKIELLRAIACGEVDGVDPAMADELLERWAASATFVRNGDGELNFNIVVTDEDRNTVLAGFAHGAPIPQGLVHSTKGTRVRILDAVIRRAVNEAGTDDTATVWVILERWAADGNHPPLVGVSQKAIVYVDRGDPANFSRDALKSKLQRMRSAAATSSVATGR